MLNHQQILAMAMQRCNNKQMVELFNTYQNKSPKELIDKLCEQFPETAKAIDEAIAKGQNPQQMVMSMLNLK